MTLQINMPFLKSTLQTMVSINSVLPHEGELATFVAETLRNMGLKPETQEATVGRPNVMTTAVFNPNNPRFLVFSGHLDTVGAASDWETDPFDLMEKDGRLYGLGVYNMKAGLACMLTALKALVEANELHPQLGRLGFAATVDQEGHSIGAKALLQTPYATCDAMLHAEHFFGDSATDYLPRATTGKVLYKISVQGKAAHAFRPAPGINAVTEAAKIAVALEKMPLGQHPLFGKGTICTLKIDGGYREYAIVVPEHCELIVNRLLVPGETRETAVSDLRQLIDSLNLDGQVTIETPPPFYEPHFMDEQTPILPIFEEVYSKVLGKKPTFAPHRGITDANVFGGEGGIPTIVFGPKGANHHRAGEYIIADTLEPVARIYAETAVRFFKNRVTESTE